MVEEGMTLFTARDRQFRVEKIQDGIIYGFEIIKPKITRNDNKIIEEVKKERSRQYPMEALGLDLFFDRSDISSRTLERDDRYAFNSEKILNRESEIRKKFKEEVLKNQPKIKFNEDMKQEIIRNYYRKDLVLEEESEFYKKYHKKYSYFGRMDLDTVYSLSYEELDLNYRANYYEKVYIGRNIDTDASQYGIYDWRNDIGKFYTSNKLNYFKEADGEYDSSLMLKRQFDFSGGEIDYVNTYVAGDKINEAGAIDPFLLKLMERKRELKGIGDIVETIQGKQDQIIRHDVNDSLIVQGVAGSGKSMILFHRLSYLTYEGNRRIEDKSKVKIISPSKLFQDAMEGLVRDLEISKIEKLSMDDYYSDILTRYFENYKIKNRNKKFKYESLLEDKKPVLNGLNNEIDRIYIDRIKKYKSKLEIDIEGFQSDFQNFRYDYDHIKDLKNKIGAAKKYLERLPSQNEILSDLKEEELEVRSYINNKMEKLAIIESLKDKTKIISESLDKGDKKEDIERKLEENLENIKVFLGSLFILDPEILRDLEVIRNMYFKNKKSKEDLKEGKIELGELLSEFDKNILKLEAYFNLEYSKLGKLTEELDQLSLRIRDEEDKFSRERMETLEDLEVNFLDDDEIIHSIYRQILEELDDLNIDFNKKYVLIRVFTLFYGPLKNRDRFLFIDEGQDYSLDEYETLALANSEDCVFNIFGDLNQLIYRDRGIDSWRDLEAYLSDGRNIEYFELKQNYRNTVEITEYSNKLLGMDMEAIGITGEDVILLESEGQIIGTMVDMFMDDKYRDNRVVLIDNNSISQHNIKLIKEIAKSYNVNLTIGKLEEFKGMEFDLGFVALANMNRNEKYIALTRPLKTLVIVDNQEEA